MDVNWLLFPIETVSSLEQPENVLSPMDVTASGMLIDVSEEHLLNAELPIDVNWLLFPIETVSSLEQP